MARNTEFISRLEILPVRQAFRNEAHDFTTWLESHVEALADRIGMRLSVVQREKEVGDFNVDLLCENEEGRPVIIENQLEKTDHDHLGKILTYLVNLDAVAAIWVTTEPRPEHQKVVDWLNESTPADISFYLVKVEASRIGDSPFAPLFTVLAGPDKQVKEIGEKKKEWAERHHQQLKFWESLLEKNRNQTKLFSNISANHHHYISSGAGKSGVTFIFSIRSDWATVVLYIDHDRETGEKNKVIFDALYRQKDEIEKEFGEPLEWQRLDDKRSSRIEKRLNEGGLDDPQTWPVLQEKMVDAMVRLDKTLRPRLAAIKV